ncbi:UNVERIFIED_CONTAM: IgA-specific metalloendopeptidase [Hammondia hammondi]|eukprot:XP_008886459.1 IgA-specific metalloendopeptidase [Hammondia hammondi]
MTRRAILLGVALLSALSLHAAAINSTGPAPYEDVFEVLARTGNPTASQEQLQPSDEDENRDVATPLEAEHETAKTNFSLRGSSGTPVNEQEGLEKDPNLTTVGHDRSSTGETLSTESSSSTEEPYSNFDDEAELQALTEFFTRLTSHATISPLAPETTTDYDEEAPFDLQEQAPEDLANPEPREEVAATAAEENTVNPTEETSGDEETIAPEAEDAPTAEEAPVQPDGGDPGGEGHC